MAVLFSSCAQTDGMKNGAILMGPPQDRESARNFTCLPPDRCFFHPEHGFANQNYESRSTVPLLEVVDD